MAGVAPRSRAHVRARARTRGLCVLELERLAEPFDCLDGDNDRLGRDDDEVDSRRARPEPREPNEPSFYTDQPDIEDAAARQVEAPNRQLRLVTNVALDALVEPLECRNGELGGRGGDWKLDTPAYRAARYPTAPYPRPVMLAGVPVLDAAAAELADTVRTTGADAQLGSRACQNASTASPSRWPNGM